MKGTFLLRGFACILLISGCSSSGEDTSPKDTTVADTTPPSDVIVGDTVGEGDTPPPNDTTEADIIVDVTPVDVPTSEGNPAGYLAGGTLGSYFGIADTEETSEKTFLFRRLDKIIDFPSGDPTFGDIYGGQTFEAQWLGGYYAKDEGVHTFRITVADSAKFILGGVTLIDVWETGTYTTEVAPIQLSKGWHSLDLTYGRNSDDALVVLSVMGPEDENFQVISTDALGYTSDPPPDEVSLAFEGLAVSNIWSFGAAINATTSAPAMVTASWDGGTHDDTIGTDPDQLNVNHSLTLTLAPETLYEVVVSAEDLWGRVVTSDPFPITTPVNPPFVSGGILGTYYNGTEFEGTPITQRFDPRLNLPADQDNNLQGSFATPMGNNNFTVRWEGALWAPETDTYILYLGADDGARLFLDQSLLVDAWDSNAFSYDEVVILLTKGWHPLTMEYIETGGNSRISLEWATSEMERMVVPAMNLGTVLPEDDLLNPEITFIDAYSSLPETFTLQWKMTELCTAQVFYTTYNQFDKVVGEEVIYDFNIPATGMKWTFEGLMPGYGQAQIVLWDRFGHVSAVIESEKVLVLEDEDD